MFKAEYLRLPLNIKTIGLNDELEQFPSNAWISHYNPKEYRGHWAVLPLRSVEGHPEVIYAVPGARLDNFYKPTKYLNSSPKLAEIISKFQCKIGSARLMKLGAGAEILEHCDDMGQNDEKEIRIHIPIQTNDDLQFWLNHQQIKMNVGEAWFADFTLPHRVINNGNTDRIHLVLDCMPNEWLAEQFQKGLVINKILSFLDKIGIKTELKHLENDTFLPGIAINQGTLIIDIEKLIYPGDILHEAGHIAVTEKEKREQLTDNVGKNDENAMGSEIATILWSYAASEAIGLDLNVVFHSAGYKGQSQWYIEQLSSGSYIGLPLLEWMGMCKANIQQNEDDMLPFPTMLKWLRD